jgi:hypothetical protein
MIVKFEITDIPKIEQKKYSIAYLEGELKIFVNETLFFHQPGILLIEFAIFIDRWLMCIKREEFVDLSFETMDNDEPILSLSYKGVNHYKIYSVWQETEVSRLLETEEIVVAFEKYMRDLAIQLKLQTGIELNKLIEDGIL